MKVVEVSAGARRDACLAMLCAEVHGREGGLDALVSYAGVRGVWFENETARLFALVDDAERASTPPPCWCSTRMRAG